jgi:hypothetical protein
MSSVKDRIAALKKNGPAGGIPIMFGPPPTLKKRSSTDEVVVESTPAAASSPRGEVDIILDRPVIAPGLRRRSSSSSVLSLNSFKELPEGLMSED